MFDRKIYAPSVVGPLSPLTSFFPIKAKSRPQRLVFDQRDLKHLCGSSVLAEQSTDLALRLSSVDRFASSTQSTAETFETFTNTTGESLSNRSVLFLSAIGAAKDKGLFAIGSLAEIDLLVFADLLPTLAIEEIFFPFA